MTKSNDKRESAAKTENKTPSAKASIPVTTEGGYSPKSTNTKTNRPKRRNGKPKKAGVWHLLRKAESRNPIVAICVIVTALATVGYFVTNLQNTIFTTASIKEERRAKIVVQRTSPPQFIPGQFYVDAVQAVNHGKSDATVIELRATGGIIAATEDFESYDPNWKPPTDYAQTQPPETPFAFITHSEVPVTQEAIDALRTGKSHFYRYGIVRYKDIYGQLHFTQYCHEFFRSIAETEPDKCDKYNKSE